MIFAAGMGSRMRPLTDKLPKALITAGDKSLLEWHIAKLIRFGIKDVIINVHYLAQSIIEFIQSNRSFGINIAVSDESGGLLDTGGGLLKASWFFDDGSPFLAVNVDVLSDIDYFLLTRAHFACHPLVTVAVRNRQTSRYLLFNGAKRLCGWENVSLSEKRIAVPGQELHRLAFSGIQMINPLIFSYVKMEGKFSLIDLYLELAGSFEIIAYLHDQDFWMDIGTEASLRKFEEIRSGVKNI